MPYFNFGAEAFALLIALGKEERMTHYQLTFVTSTGTRRSFRINNVDPDITQSNLQAAVDMLLDHDIMAAERGSLSGLQSLTANTITSISPLG